MAVNWRSENQYTVDDPYNLTLGTDDRRRNDRGARYPTDLGDVHPGVKVTPFSATMGASTPAHDIGDNIGGGIVQPDGYGGQESNPSAPPPGPDSPDYDPGTSSDSDSQDELDALEDADHSKYATCPTVTSTFGIAGLVSKVGGGGPCGEHYDVPRNVCTNSGSYQERVKFNTQAEAVAYAAALNAARTSTAITGETYLWLINYSAGTDDCMGTGTSDGPIGYHNDGDSGYGSGAVIDGVSSVGWGE